MIANHLVLTALKKILAGFIPNRIQQAIDRDDWDTLKDIQQKRNTAVLEFQRQSIAYWQYLQDFFKTKLRKPIKPFANINESVNYYQTELLTDNDDDDIDLYADDIFNAGDWTDMCPDCDRNLEYITNKKDYSHYCDTCWDHIVKAIDAAKQQSIVDQWILEATKLVERRIKDRTLRKHVAATGSVYLTLSVDDDTEIKIRISDHKQVSGGGFRQDEHGGYRMGATDIDISYDEFLKSNIPIEQYVAAKLSLIFDKKTH